MDGLPLVAPDRAPLKSDRIAIHDLSRGAPTDRTRQWSDDIIAELRDSDDIEWIFARWRIEEDPAYGQIADRFVLVEDYEGRFRPLRGLLQRFGAPYPRYLYRRVDRADAAAEDAGTE